MFETFACRRWTGQAVMTVPYFAYKVSAQRAGLGCGYLPVHIAAPEIAAGRLVAREIAQGRVVAPVHLAWREPVQGRALAWFILAFSRLALGGEALVSVSPTLPGCR